MDAGDLLDGVVLPEEFSWGVGASGYQIEGGINVPGGPRNNWAAWEDSGRIEPTGVCNRFWDEPEPILGLTSAAGCGTFRYGIEWARIWPTPDGADHDALSRYAEIMGEGSSMGVEPLVNCSHFTHPEWMGIEPWVDEPERTIEAFGRHAALLATELNLALLAAGHLPIRRWITLNEANILPLMTYLVPTAPPACFGRVRRAMAMRDALFAAHVIAYDAIWDVYEQHGWPSPLVTTNTAASSTYELDLMLLGLLTAADRGVPWDRLEMDLTQARNDFLRRRRVAVDPAAGAVLTHPSLPGRAMQRGEARLAERAAGLRSLPRTLAALKASDRPTKLDFIGADFYYPFTEDMLRRPGRRSPDGGRWWTPDVRLVEHTPNPVGVTWYLTEVGRFAKPVLFVESGMCSWGTNPRPDGWTRPRFLRENLTAMLAAMYAGVEVVGYHHWSIVDNYEWGTFLPRFGLHAVERDGTHSSAKVSFSTRDAMGDDAAGELRRLIESLGAEPGTPERRAALGG